MNSQTATTTRPQFLTFDFDPMNVETIKKRYQVVQALAHQYLTSVEQHGDTPREFVNYSVDNNDTDMRLDVLREIRRQRRVAAV